MTAKQCREMQVLVKNKGSKSELNAEYVLWEIATQLAEFNEREEESMASQGESSS